MDRFDADKAATDWARTWAINGLRANFPHLSARRTFSTAQIPTFVFLAFCLAGAIAVAPEAVGLALHVVVFVGFGCAITLRAVAAAASLTPPRSTLARIDESRLPTYALLIALYREANSAGDLIAALNCLDYPKDRLEIILILEPDDHETYAAMEAALSRARFQTRVLLAPEDGPRTKPKALNFGLAHTDADLIGVYDAEDRPDPAQLKAAAAAFSKGGGKLACVQAPLFTDNPRASWLADQFRAEYAIHFSQLVPFLCRAGLPPPLGGTSNHFRRQALWDIGGWDPYNVTEDADLGYRLARLGWRIDSIAPPTFEEAPATLSGWIRQRSRWIKGHMQTWLVLMRDPIGAWHGLGGAGFIAVQLMLAGAVAAAFLHAPTAIIVVWAFFANPNALFVADWWLVEGGLAVAVFCAGCAAWTLRQPSLLLSVLTMPLYWPLSFVAAVRALLELIARPHYWAKTEHGLTPRDPTPCLPQT